LESTKVCSICNIKKSLNDFYKQNKHSEKKGNYIYYNPECKECTKKKARKWAIENPERKRASVKKNRHTENTIMYHREKSKRWRENGKRKQWEEKNKDRLIGYAYFSRMNKIHNITANEWENCKNYFNYRCAYCGLPIEEHYIIRKGITKLGDFHKEHVDHNGENDLSNCIPSCKICNSTKHIFEFEEWYNDKNEIYSIERYEKIIKWLKKDYKNYIEENNKN